MNQATQSTTGWWRFLATHFNTHIKPVVGSALITLSRSIHLVSNLGRVQAAIGEAREVAQVVGVIGMPDSNAGPVGTEPSEHCGLCLADAIPRRGVGDDRRAVTPVRDRDAFEDAPVELRDPMPRWRPS